MLSPKVIAQLARPLRLLNRRSLIIERLIDSPLSLADEELIRIGCETSGQRIGSFYHWYLQKFLVKERIRGIDRSGALSLIDRVDYTNYDDLSRIMSHDNGVLIATPHHGHYIFSIISLAEHLRHARQVYVFYGEPKTHHGNEVFDELHGVIWGGSGQGVEVIHDTRQGMAKAIRGLKNGDVVVIMPDVFKREEDTSVIPFCGRPMNVMLGTAMLARKTGAWILPAVALQHGHGMGFKTWFGEWIENATGEGDASPEQTRIQDYHVTRQIFEQYESEPPRLSRRLFPLRG